MSESNFMPSLNNLPSAEYIPSGPFETARVSPEQRAARQNVNEALAAAATVSRAPEYPETLAAPAKAEIQSTPEAVQIDYIRKASKNLAFVRQAAQSDYAQAA